MSSAANNNALVQAESLLLTPYGLGVDALGKVFGEMAAHQLDDADLYFQYSRSEGWSLDEGIVKSGSFNIDQGVGVRAISGEKTAFAYSDDISFAALSDAAKAVRAIGSVGGQGTVPQLRGRSLIHRLYAPNDPLASLQAQAKVDLLHRLEAFARQADTRVVQVMAGLAGEYEVVLVARADGTLAADIRPLVRVSVTVIVEENGLREQGSSGGGGRFYFG
jgi:TldD protein